MTSHDPILEELAALQRTAPVDLLDRVLLGADLADSYTEIEGPTGRAFVAWNGRGVTTFVPAEAVGTRDAFEARHPRAASFVDAPPDAALLDISTSRSRPAVSVDSPSICRHSASSNARCSRNALRSRRARSVPTGGLPARSTTPAPSAPLVRLSAGIPCRC